MTIISNKELNKKEIRLNSIYEKLKNNSFGWKISELAEYFEVSTKTIKRDLEMLSKNGAVKEGNSWKIDPSKAISDIDPKDIILSSLEYEKENTELYTLLDDAIKNQVQIIFDYKEKNRNCKPLKLVFFDGYWYLLAFEMIEEKEIFKTFHLNSISNILMQEKTFEVTSKIEDRLKYANSIWFNLNELFPVYLYINKNTAKYFERKPLKGQKIIKKCSEGSLIIKIYISNKMEILPRVFNHLPHIKILKPISLKNEVNQILRDYISDE